MIELSVRRKDVERGKEAFIIIITSRINEVGSEAEAVHSCGSRGSVMICSLLVSTMAPTPRQGS
jgi:hypothetical protein